MDKDDDVRKERGPGPVLCWRFPSQRKREWSTSNWNGLKRKDYLRTLVHT